MGIADAGYRYLRLWGNYRLREMRGMLFCVVTCDTS
jgi:hypothetical protein